MGEVESYIESLNEAVLLELERARLALDHVESLLASNKLVNLQFSFAPLRRLLDQRDALLQWVAGGGWVPESKVKEVLDLAVANFPERLPRALELIRMQAEALGLELPEKFGEVEIVEFGEDE